MSHTGPGEKAGNEVRYYNANKIVLVVHSRSVTIHNQSDTYKVLERITCR